MAGNDRDPVRRRKRGWAIVLLAAAAGLSAAWFLLGQRPAEAPPLPPSIESPYYISKLFESSRRFQDDSGQGAAWSAFPLPIRDPSSLTEIRDAYVGVGSRGARLVEEELARCLLSPEERLEGLLVLARLHLYEGRFAEASAALVRARRWAVEGPFSTRPREREQTVLFFQGVAALRRGEVDNCVACCCGTSCILPLGPEAVHQKPAGSREAIEHFTEFLRSQPDSMGARWLLNLACATLGEYPEGVPEPYRIALWPPSPENDVGRFRNIAARVGLDRLNQAGGAIMDDFDNDGLLDVFTTSMDPAQAMAFYRNRGDGTFEDRSRAAGLAGQFGGLYCVQGDYDNDGFLDVFVCRGAYTRTPQRPTLLHNNGDGTFTDATRAAGVDVPIDSQVAAWADYDNDGWLDLFVGGESVRGRLYHNRGDGTFEEVAVRAGVARPGLVCKGAAWGDYDGDGLPDLFVNHTNGPPCLFHNNGDGTFTDVAPRLGITRPAVGFSCWFWDYDNDGHLDLFAAATEPRLDKVVRSWLGLPHDGILPRLYRNRGDGTFEDVTAAVGLDKAMCPMGSNFVDVDNDGFLDVYLGTGTPDYSMLVPNRLFRNEGGRRFVDVTVSSGTGHLQKGHAVACGDWDRDGNVDIFEEMGGGTPGDQAHNVLFQNPGHAHPWITVKLVGKKTNRAAIGARVKVTLDGGRAIYRTVTSGSSFGGNALQQTIGLGPATRIQSLEVFWPASKTTQTFRDVPLNQALEITELATDYRRLNWSRVPNAAVDESPSR